MWLTKITEISIRLILSFISQVLFLGLVSRSGKSEQAVVFLLVIDAILMGSHRTGCLPYLAAPANCSVNKAPLDAKGPCLHGQQ